MRVVFLEDVPGVAQGGEVKEVKNGFARNYLIPKSLATPATHNALHRVEKLSRHADVTRVKRLEDMRELASEIEGAQIEVEMRAGSTGRLYGSVTGAIIAERLGEITEREIDRRTVELEEPIRDLGEYGVTVSLHPEVRAGISVLVYPMGTTAEEFAESLRAQAEAAAAAEAEAAEAAEAEESESSEEEAEE
jgi:large subunit ribosomal protein L9